VRSLLRVGILPQCLMGEWGAVYDATLTCLAFFNFVRIAPR
jgi:hypothetical protein